jgi:hypothetical protein
MLVCMHLVVSGHIILCSVCSMSPDPMLRALTDHEERPPEGKRVPRGRARHAVVSSHVNLVGARALVRPRNILTGKCIENNNGH